MDKKGIFIVLEGLDGCGTTTQTALLKDWFAGPGAKYGKCAATCEPTAGPAGSLARMALNHRLHLDKHTLALLFAADRTDHVFKKNEGGQEPGLAQRLAQGVHVISDRYLLSSLAYQSLDLPMEWILQINSRVIKPDLTIYIEIDPETAQKRLSQGRLHQDLYEALETQRRVRQQYEEAMALLIKDGHRISRVNGDQPLTAVQNDIVKELLPFLEKL
ncbi:MAG: dTMP kinase [Clostridiales bacterium]